MKTWLGDVDMDQIKQGLDRLHRAKDRLDTRGDRIRPLPRQARPLHPPRCPPIRAKAQVRIDELADPIRGHPDIEQQLAEEVAARFVYPSDESTPPEV
jgi:hypothetical protein